MGNPIPSPINPTNADIYHRIGQIEGKFDEYMRQGLLKRVSSLERSRAWITGVGAVIAGGIALIFKGDA